jgi:aquaporin Z
MATKKAASNAKKSTANKSVAKKQTTTKVTTVKAVESHPIHRSASARNVTRRFGLMRTPLVAALIAEFIGTFVFAGAVIASSGQPLYVLFALVGVVLAIGTISGGYANPALVVGAWVTRRMSGTRAIGYIVAQILGAMLAFVVLNAFVSAVPHAATAYSSAPELFKMATLPKGHEWFVFWSELVGMLIFGFAAASVIGRGAKRLTGAFTIGLGLFLGLMVAGSAAAYLSATAVLNPAVAVALQGINFTSVWPIAIYFVGSMLGAVIGFVLFDYLRAAEKK